MEAEDWVGIGFTVLSIVITVITIVIAQSKLGEKVAENGQDIRNLRRTMEVNEVENKADHDKLEGMVKRLGRRTRKDRRRRRDDRQRLVRALVD